jgi:hypothetical protein
MTRVVKNLSVMRTDESDRHLKIIMEAKGDQSTATRWALEIAANILKYAWQGGHEDRGVVPDMRVSFRVKTSEKGGRVMPEPQRVECQEGCGAVLEYPKTMCPACKHKLGL